VCIALPIKASDEGRGVVQNPAILGNTGERNPPAQGGGDFTEKHAKSLKARCAASGSGA